MYSVIYDHQMFSLQEYGGISRYFCELASRIHRIPGFQARVVAPVHFNSYLSACPVPQTAAYLPKRVPRSGFLYRATNALLSPLLTRASSPALIHRTYYAPHAKRVDIPTVVTVFDMIHELFPDSFSANDPVIRNKRPCLERADHIVCISECTANDLVRLFGVARKKISVTYLGYSNEFAFAGSADEVSPSKRPYLLYVGGRAGYKNFDLALKAYANSSRLARDFDFVAFGGLPFNAAEKELVTSLHLRPDSVARWTGSDADLARAYRHARALVYPSKYEGFGMPPLEAMSSGCAVACSNASSIPEVVGEAAAMFDPNDLESIRQVLEDLCLNDSARTRMVVAGRERIRHFSWDRCASETAAAYERVLGSVAE
jgi:glycosyltransferase involved in cell wall biosynthesis